MRLILADGVVGIAGGWLDALAVSLRLGGV
jgi:hypothetical protein